MTRGARASRRFSIGTRWVLRYTATTSLLLVLVATLIYNRISNLVLEGIEIDLREATQGINERSSR